MSPAGSVAGKVERSAGNVVATGSRSQWRWGGGRRFGGGGDEWAHSDSAVLAFGGRNGHLLWHTSARNQLVGSATFPDINDDQTPDVIIGGRSAELQAIDGKTGRKLWKFYQPTEKMGHKRAGQFNFTNVQLIPDQDVDSRPDLLIANGGDATVNNTKTRPGLTHGQGVPPGF